MNDFPKKTSNARFQAEPQAEFPRERRRIGPGRTSMLTVSAAPEGWTVTSASGRPLGVCRTKKEAVALARQRAAASGVGVVIERLDGTVQERVHPRG